MPEYDDQGGQQRFLCVEQSEDIERFRGKGQPFHTDHRKQKAEPGDDQDRIAPHNGKIMKLLLVHELFHPGTGRGKAQEIFNVPEKIEEVLGQGDHGLSDGEFPLQHFVQ